MELTAHRDRLYDWLRRCLVGKGDTLFGIKPLDRYQTGTLFPVVRGEFGLDPAGQEADGGDDAVDDEEDVDDSEQAARGTSPRKRRFVPPSSVGFSFFVSGDQVRFQLIPRAVRYVREEDRRDEAGRFVPESWSPEGVGVDLEGLDLAAPARRKVHTDRELVFGKRAELLVLWRPLENGWLVTASLSNTQSLEPTGYGGEAPEDSLAEGVDLLMGVPRCWSKGYAADYNTQPMLSLQRVCLRTGAICAAARPADRGGEVLQIEMQSRCMRHDPLQPGARK